MAEQASNPFEGLYGFVRGHLLIVNNMLTGSCFLVATLDFLAPKLWLLPPDIHGHRPPCLGHVGHRPCARSRGQGPGPLLCRAGWRRSAVAQRRLAVRDRPADAGLRWRLRLRCKSNQGGIAASSFQPIRNLQADLLSLRSDVADIKTGVGEANAKLDRIAGSVDPAQAADRCADLECAVSGGASPEAVRKLFAKGAKVPGDPINQAALLVSAATSQSAGRLEVIEQLLRNGIDRDLPLHGHLTDPAGLTKAGALNAKRVFDEAELAASPSARFAKELQGKTELDRWNSVAGCLLRSSGGMTLIEFAALQGDQELFERMAARGAKPRVLSCKKGGSRAGGMARVDIGKSGSISVHGG